MLPIVVPLGLLDLIIVEVIRIIKVILEIAKNQKIKYFNYLFIFFCVKAPALEMNFYSSTWSRGTLWRPDICYIDESTTSHTCNFWLPI